MNQGQFFEQQEIMLNDTMPDIFRRYLTERESSAATIEKYMRDIHTFFRFLEGRRSFTKETLIEYKQWLIGHYAVSSVNSMLVALNQFLVSLNLGNMKVKRLKVQRQHFCERKTEMTKVEYQRLVRTARAQGKEQLALIMETICSTGIRISELSQFCAEDITRGMVKVTNKGKHRQVILPRALQKKLLFYIRRKQIKKGAVFITKNGKAKDRSNIWREMKQLAAKAGVSANKIFPHNLRHLFARTFYKTTKNLAQLADILGHSNLEITRIYTSETVEQWRKSIEKLNLLE